MTGKSNSCAFTDFESPEPPEKLVKKFRSILKRFR